MPYNIQFTTNTPKAFSEAGVSDVVNLDAVGHKFAASFWPKTAEKTYFLWKLRFSQTFYFYHSFWKTLYTQNMQI